MTVIEEPLVRDPGSLNYRAVSDQEGKNKKRQCEAVYSRAKCAVSTFGPQSKYGGHYECSPKECPSQFLGRWV